MSLLQTTKAKATSVVVALSAMMLATTASAELPANQAAAYTAVGGLVTDHETAAWAIVIAVTVAIVGIGLFKKFVKRSAS